MEVKSITNINYDCLERIFDFLDLETLLNVACTSKRLQIAAAAKFGDEFGKKTILLYPFCPGKPKISIDGDEIMVTKQKHCLPFLRCFGVKISDLGVNFGFNNGKNINVSQYINQYCADTLMSIAYQCPFEISCQAFQKPFKNVEKVEMYLFHFVHNHLAILADSFPNLRDLKMINCNVDETASMNVSFPHLEHVTFGVFSLDSNISPTYENIVNANQQLQSLTIRLNIQIALNTLLRGISQNSNILKFIVINEHHNTKDVNVDELNRFVAEHPLMTEVQLQCYRLTADDAKRFIGQMKELKRFEFQLQNRSECDLLMSQLDDEWQHMISTGGNQFYIDLKR